MSLPLLRALEGEVREHKQAIKRHREALRAKAEELASLRAQLEAAGISLTYGVAGGKHGRQDPHSQH